ncbi:hypothetical protein HGD80_01455 [Paulownia witches'-broom phytoplasma]|uniref:DNA methylase N-4/N-6 domain-containing protein n=1 Tax=Paulownia witches'-broom phytoplasma TaxID=39647 RepID=A0ABX8TQ15_9MOLU|nr:hypothetical protein HGD80_01455 [Paulownia witches'-broom phytoplasma]
MDKIDSFSHIILGDVCEFLPQLQNIKFNIVIADPPYNIIGKNFGNNRDLLEIDGYLKWSLDWIQQCLKLLTPDGIFYMYDYPEILARVAAQFPYEKKEF